MTLLFWGITLGTLGKILVIITVLRVHNHIYKERRIDDDVLRALRADRNAALVGLAFIIAGYALEVWFYAHNTIIL